MQLDLPNLFTREHDVILFAGPFSVAGVDAEWDAAYCERLAQARQRHLLRSARWVDAGRLQEAVQAGCGTRLAYRLLPGCDLHAVSAGMLLTCASPSHLALTNLLERGGLFTVRDLGRVVRT